MRPGKRNAAAKEKESEMWHIWSEGAVWPGKRLTTDLFRGPNPFSHTGMRWWVAVFEAL